MFRRSIIQSVRFVSHKPPRKSANVPKIPGDNEVKPKAYAPPTPNIELRSSNVPYYPKENHQRVSFEYPNEETQTDKSTKLRWRGVLPIGIVLIGGGWALYTLNYFTDPTPTEYLSPDKFIPFIVTNKLDIDKDHYLIELTPKFNKWKKEPKENKIWNGSRLWSVEVKQPQIMVVRRYTPLPLEIYKSEQTGEPIIRLQSGEEESNDGKLVFYIKKYDQGEVARWIYRKPLGSEIELRGPFIDYEFVKTINDRIERPQFTNLPSQIGPDPKYPLKPDNLAFFAAGTGIAPLLQMTLSVNPYKGFIDVFYSRKTESEVPLVNFLYFLEKLDRIKIHSFVEEKNKKLTLKDVPKPVKSQLILKNEKYLREKQQREELIAQKLRELKNGDSSTIIDTSSVVPDEEEKPSIRYANALDQAKTTMKQPKLGPSLAIVCGPDGYISYVAGPKPYNTQGPVGGLLKEKGWDEENVFKM